MLEEWLTMLAELGEISKEEFNIPKMGCKIVYNNTVTYKKDGVIFMCIKPVVDNESFNRLKSLTKEKTQY